MKGSTMLRGKTITSAAGVEEIVVGLRTESKKDREILSILYEWFEGREYSTLKFQARLSAAGFDRKKNITAIDIEIKPVSS